MLKSSTSGRPRPAMNRDTRFFWEGLDEGKLLAQRCASCHVVRHPPGPVCSKCFSFEWDTVELDGRGVIYSYTVQHHPVPPGFDGPAAAVLVQLDGGTRLLSTLVDCPIDGFAIGDRVEISFVPQQEGWTAHEFRLVTD